MDEKENFQTEETVLDDLVGSDGVSDDVDDDTGSESVSVPDGDDGQASTGDISSGDVSPDISSGDIGSDSVSAGDAAEGDSSLGGDTALSVHTETSVDYTENLLLLQASLISINATLFLIFLFLIMSWTEKKISVSVRKFTRERRR